MPASAGPAVGGVLIAADGVRWAYAIDVVTYAASLLAVWALPRLPPLGDVERPSFKAIADGFRFLKGRQALIGIFLVDTNAMVFGMPSALFPAIALHHLHGNATTVGLPLRGAVGRCARVLAPLGLDVARPAHGPRRHGDGLPVGRSDRRVRAT